MSDFTITAESVINSVMQDGQVQTTNRGLLLDYVNRTSLRILRESQWVFLQSDVKKFITEPGSSKYWIGSGGVKPGCSNTNLSLSDLGSVLPESVYDLTNALNLRQDSPSVQNQDSFLYQDGAVRPGLPVSFAYRYNDPGVFHLFPIPDNQNVYYPVPASPVTSTVPGGNLGDRTYYIVTSFVDAFGNEGTPSNVPTTLGILGGNLAVVDSPSAEVQSANQIAYNGWNVYVGTAFAGPYFLQNAEPIMSGASWQEPVQGLTTTYITPGLSFPLIDTANVLWNVGVGTDGLLQATSAGTTAFSAQRLFIQDTNNIDWRLGIGTSGIITTTQQFGTAPAPLFLLDSAANVWGLSVEVTGNLVTTLLGALGTVATTPSRQPLANSNLTPLNGYVIAFRYQKSRIQITDPSQVLQVPQQYYDVVVAGVNYYANLYTSKSDDINIKVAVWKREFMDGLAQIRRDFRINYRNTDFVTPDKATQYHITGQSWYYGQ